MFPIPKLNSVLDLYYGRDPYLDAWLLHFMTENNIEYFANPYENASPEQMRFMVDLDENQVFVPCSDSMLRILLRSEKDDELKKEYRNLWRSLVRLIYHIVKDDYSRRKIVILCKHKFQKAYRSPFIIPSRLNKRMLTIILSQSAQIDPYSKRKSKYNKNAFSFIESSEFSDFVGMCPIDRLECKNIQELRCELDLMELKRLFFVCLYVKRYGKMEIIQIYKLPWTRCRALKEFWKRAFSQRDKEMLS